jgi:hypothetical protein
MNPEEIKKICNEDKLESLVNDKNVVSTHNVIPNGRQVNRKDIDNFVERIKSNRQEK